MLKSSPSASGSQSVIVHLAKRKNNLVISGSLFIASSLIKIYSLYDSTINLKAYMSISDGAMLLIDKATE